MALHLPTVQSTPVISMKGHLLARLEASEGPLPDDLRARLLAHGIELVPELLAMVRGADLSRGGGDFTKDPRGGWPLINAVNLLGELKVVEAVEPMLDLMDRTSGELVHEWIKIDVSQIGMPVLEAAIPRFERCKDPVLRESYEFLLAGVRIPNSYVWEMLCKAFAKNEIDGAILFAHHGDPRALPLLEAALRRIQAKGYCDEVHYELGELLCSYEGLGSSIPDDLAEYVSDVYAEWERREGVRTR